MNPTCFAQIIGNDDIKLKLDRMLAKRAMGHALLFAGPEGIGKSLFAWALAARIMKEYDPSKDHSGKIARGQHPDVHVYRPEGKLGLHSIQTMRQLSEEVFLPPFEASWKVFIIHDADRMLSYSANALLKTFEEPPPRTLIILLSRSQAALLPTILSRCSTLHFRSIPDASIRDYLKEKFSLDETLSEKIVHLAKGSLGRAVRLATQGDGIHQSILSLLAQGRCSDYRSMQQAIQGICDQVEAAKKISEEQAKEEMSHLFQERLPAAYQQALEKEIEGLIASVYVQEAQALFEDILSWYRDCQLILLGGSTSLLSNPEYKMELEQAVARGECQPLHEVYQAIEKAYLALQRSTSLTLCLENLFLRLNRIHV